MIVRVCSYPLSLEQSALQDVRSGVQSQPGKERLETCPNNPGPHSALNSFLGALTAPGAQLLSGSERI